MSDQQENRYENSLVQTIWKKGELLPNPPAEYYALGVNDSGFLYTIDSNGNTVTVNQPEDIKIAPRIYTYSHDTSPLTILKNTWVSILKFTEVDRDGYVHNFNLDNNTGFITNNSGKEIFAKISIEITGEFINNEGDDITTMLQLVVDNNIRDDFNRKLYLENGTSFSMNIVTKLLSGAKIWFNIICETPDKDAANIDIHEFKCDILIDGVQVNS